MKGKKMKLAMAVMAMAAILAQTTAVFGADSSGALQQQIQKLNPYRYYQDDFNHDGTEEAFVLTEPIKGSSEGYGWRAKIYFVTEKGSQLLKDNDEDSWFYTPDPTSPDSNGITIAQSNGYKAFCVYGHPQAGYSSYSYVFTVNQAGEVKEHNLPGWMEKDMRFVTYGYDVEYADVDLPDDSDSFAGGTDTKQHFFYMDAKGNLREYGAVEITKEQLLLFDGAESVLKTIEQEGRIIDILYRANGYIQINVRDDMSRVNYLLRYRDGKVSLVTNSENAGWGSYYGLGFITYESPYAVKPVFTPPAKTVRPASSAVVINGKPVSFDAYNIDGNTYFKLRDVAMALNGTKQQFNVVWDQDKKAVNLISNTPYEAVGNELKKGDGLPKKASPNTSSIYQDGNPVDLDAYAIGDNTYFKLRDLGEAFDFAVGWNNLTKTITIDTK